GLGVVGVFVELGQGHTECIPALNQRHQVLRVVLRMPLDLPGLLGFHLVDRVPNHTVETSLSLQLVIKLLSKPTIAALAFSLSLCVSDLPQPIKLCLEMRIMVDTTILGRDRNRGCLIGIDHHIPPLWVLLLVPE